MVATTAIATIKRKTTGAEEAEEKKTKNLETPDYATLKRLIYDDNEEKQDENSGKYVPIHQ